MVPDRCARFFQTFFPYIIDRSNWSYWLLSSDKHQFQIATFQIANCQTAVCLKLHVEWLQHRTRTEVNQDATFNQQYNFLKKFFDKTFFLSATMLTDRQTCLVLSKVLRTPPLAVLSIAMRFPGASQRSTEVLMLLARDSTRGRRLPRHRLIRSDNFSDNCRHTDTPGLNTQSAGALWSSAMELCFVADRSGASGPLYN